MRGIDELDVAGQTVLLRVDLNVPSDGDRITDDGRIRASLPTITKLAGRGARVLACAHLGRPKGATYDERAAGGPSYPGEIPGFPCYRTRLPPVRLCRPAGCAPGSPAGAENTDCRPAPGASSRRAGG